MAKLKICGINDEDFALAAADARVDFLGFIFANKSPRRITAEKARQIRAAVIARQPSRFTRFVGVFVEQRIDEIREIASSIPLDVIQLHSPAYTGGDVAALKSSGCEVWRLDSPMAGSDAAADAILVDGATAGAFGGTGRLADWSRIPELKSAGRRVVLAGGISSENIAAALAANADVIDVNSSLETSSAVKSTRLLEEFMQAYRSASPAA